MLRSYLLELLALAVACSACSSTNETGGDASDSGVEASDAPADVGFPPCDTSKPFGAPVMVAELSTGAHDLFARLTHDELTVYFERYDSPDGGPGGKGGAELLVATRPNVLAPFGAATLLTSVNSPDDDFDPSVTGDDLTLYFASNRPNGAGLVDLWMATRADTTSPFGNVTNVAALSTSTANEHTPYVLADGLTIYFTGLQSSLERATRTSTTPFALDTSGALDPINTNNAEVAPVVTPDELTLYFGSLRSGSQMLDVYRATRTSTANPFGTITRLAEVDTAGNDVPAWISDDGCRLYMHSDVAGTYDIYVATKP